MRAADPGREAPRSCWERRPADERRATRRPSVPDARGRFGTYGGRYVPGGADPRARRARRRLARSCATDPGFRAELGDLAARLRRPADARHVRGPAVGAELGYDDLAQARGPRAHRRPQDQQRARPGAARQASRARTRIIAETGAGQHGVATATACALLGLPCVVYMGEEDTHRQAPNVARMKLLGAEVVPVTAGTRTLKEAVNEALRDWAASVAEHALHHRFGRGPASVPVARARPAAGDRRRGARAVRGRARRPTPRSCSACVGGGINAIGMFTAFVGAPGVELIGVEAGGRGIEPRRALLVAHAGAARHPARRAQLPAAGCRRPGRRDAFDLGRAGLPGRRTRARLPERRGPRAIRRAPPTRRRSQGSRRSRAPRASCRRSSRPT